MIEHYLNNKMVTFNMRPLFSYRLNHPKDVYYDDNTRLYWKKHLLN